MGGEVLGEDWVSRDGEEMRWVKGAIQGMEEEVLVSVFVSVVFR